MTIILASGNSHKREEIEKILPGHRILLPSEAGLTFDVEEDGETYLENALKKARSLGNQAEYPVLADDSGLSIPALNGEPGIFSARYGSEETGRNLEAGERNAYLLEKMKGVKNRQGFFVCAMVLYLSPYRFFIAQETMDGIITESPRGEGGFGYDPVFFLPEYGQTVAELPWELKNQISHRGKAGARIRSILKELKEHQ